MVFNNRRDLLSTIYYTARPIHSTKYEFMMVPSQRNAVANGMAERNTGAAFITLGCPLYPAAPACQNFALDTDPTDYLM